MDKEYKFGVNPRKEEELYRKMKELGIREDDVVEKFVRSRGKGGQNVNKRATCVYLKHIPTGIEVKCQKERSQSLNRFLARRLLVEKIEELKLGRESEKWRRIEKIKKQKKKLAKRAKRKILNKEVKNEIKV